MCGIVGIRRFDGRAVSESLLRAMAGNLSHRGPDGRGVAVYGSTGFGHTRLSVIDVDGSAQPMRSVNGPVAITYNGELFNYRELREQLRVDGVELRTQGDTEVLLEILRREGLAGLDRVNGQFAFAFHDIESGSLMLARDRLGILPLYYATGPDFLAFASEIKALLPALGGRPQLDEDAVEDYLTYRSVPPPRTMFRGVKKMRPGTVLHVGCDGSLREEVYWSLPAALPAAAAGGMLAGEDALVQTERALERALELRLVADVPVGAYLSGGLDSSLCTALMKRARAGGEVQTFSAGFDDPRFDELPYARMVAGALRAEHHEVHVTPRDFEDLWGPLSWHRDGPISEPADVAIHRIAVDARKHVKVLLSGEGSDEIFAGYPKHAMDPRLRVLAAIPSFLRVPAFRMLERVLPPGAGRSRIAARALAARTTAERMQTWFAPFAWYERGSLRRGYGSLRVPDHWERAAGDHLRRMLYVDCHTWLADNLLERGDRMSMAAGIENRPPFMDHELVDLAFRVDSSMKVKGKSGKWIIKEIARRYLPPEIVDRKKVGFRVPLDVWFRSGLREFSHDLLLGNDSFVSSWLERSEIERMLQDHRTGRRNEELRLWTLLGLEVFERRCLRNQGSAVGRELPVGSP